MCNCIEDVKESCKKYGSEVKIVGASFYVGKDSKFYDFMTGKARYTDHKGRKKSKDLMFTFCPFCGKEYDFANLWRIKDGNV